MNREQAEDWMQGGGLQDLAEMMRGSETEWPPNELIEVTKPDGTIRPIEMPAIRTQVASEALRRHFESALDLPDCFFCRRRRDDADKVGPEEAVELAVDAVVEKTAIRADIENFYGSIPHEVVRETLSGVVAPVDIDRAIELATLPAVTKNGEVAAKDGVGLSQGNPLSPLIAHWSISDIPNRIDELVDFQAWYVDDVLLVPAAGTKAEEVTGVLDEELSAHGLSLKNSEVPQISHNPNEDFEFLQTSLRTVPRRTISDGQGEQGELGPSPVDRPDPEDDNPNARTPGNTPPGDDKQTDTSASDDLTCPTGKDEIEIQGATNGETPTGNLQIASAMPLPSIPITLMGTGDEESKGEDGKPYNSTPGAADPKMQESRHLVGSNNAILHEGCRASWVVGLSGSHYPDLGSTQEDWIDRVEEITFSVLASENRLLVEIDEPDQTPSVEVDRRIDLPSDTLTGSPLPEEKFEVTFLNFGATPEDMGVRHRRQIVSDALRRYRRCCTPGGVLLACLDAQDMQGTRVCQGAELRAMESIPFWQFDGLRHPPDKRMYAWHRKTPGDHTLTIDGNADLEVRRIEEAHYEVEDSDGRRLDSRDSEWVKGISPRPQAAMYDIVTEALNHLEPMDDPLVVVHHPDLHTRFLTNWEPRKSYLLRPVRHFRRAVQKHRPVVFVPRSPRDGIRWENTVTVSS